MARQSRHLTATTVGEGVLVSYEDSSNVLNVMYNIMPNTGLEWRNMTSDILSTVVRKVEADSHTDVQLANACTFTGMVLFCLITNKQRSMSGNVKIEFYNVTNVSGISFDGKAWRG